MSGTAGLSPNDIFNVTVNLGTPAVQGNSFDTLLVAGHTLINTGANMNYGPGGPIRIASFSGPTIETQVAAIYGTSAPEYLATTLYLEQQPQPQSLQIGLILDTGAPGMLFGGGLTLPQQAIASWQAVTAGSLNVVAGTPAVPTTTAVVGINLSSVQTLNDVAAILTTAISAALPTGISVVVQFDPLNAWFVMQRATSGANSNLGFATVNVTGTDLATKLAWLSTQGGTVVAGLASESLAAGLSALRAASSTWYAVVLGLNPQDANLTIANIVAAANAVQAFGYPSLFGVTTMDPGTLVANNNGLAQQLAANGLTRTFCVYSSTSFYAAASMFGRAATVDFTGLDTAITLKFAQCPGLVPEVITETQNSVLISKNCNVYAQYSDNVAFLQQGVMCDGTFFDIIQDTDNLANGLQTNLINVLIAQSGGGGKLPQTDAGMAQLQTACDQILKQYVDNGVIGEDLAWRGGKVGGLAPGQILPSGWYLFQPSVNAQTAADRSARKAPLITICINLAGAVHSGSVILNVVR